MLERIITLFLHVVLVDNLRVNLFQVICHCYLYPNQICRCAVGATKTVPRADNIRESSGLFGSGRLGCSHSGGIGFSFQDKYHSTLCSAQSNMKLDDQMSVRRQLFNPSIVTQKPFINFILVCGVVVVQVEKKYSNFKASER